MPYEYNQGYRRAWEHNKELVGGEYPAEQDDWGFRDGSPITKLFTKNGQLEWYTLADGKQHILFTDLRDGRRDRYVLEDPPSNTLIRVWSPGRQDPDTGAALDTPSDGGETPLPGPEPTPVPTPPAEPVNGLLLSAFASKVTNWNASQMTLDAFRRAHDEARKQRVPIILDVTGQILFETLDDPDCEILGAPWINPYTIWLIHDARSQDILFKHWKKLSRFSIDGQASAIEPCTYEIFYGGRDQIATDLLLHNFRFLGIGANSAAYKGGGVWRNSHISGTSPGGNIMEGRNNTAHFGVHTDDTQHGLTVSGGSIKGCGLNAIFFAGQGDVAEDVDMFDNHRAHNPEGFGGGQMCAAGIGYTLRRLRLHDPAAHGSGLELDGDGGLIEDCEVSGNTGKNGVTFQRGKHTFRNNRVHHNGVGAHITKEDRSSEIPDPAKQFYANERNVVRD
jgi:hypothetical protein